MGVLGGLRLARRPLERAASSSARLLHHVTRATQDRSRGSARHEQETADKQSAADDRRTGLPDERGERAADREADEAARVLAEERHQAEEAHSHAETERPHLEEVAAGEQQPAQRDERDGQHVRGVADDLRQHAGEP